MINDTQTTVSITMSNVDQATKLHKALVRFMTIAAEGGDVELWMHTNGGQSTFCGAIGHDVMIESVHHEVPET
jgi:hypothetical protein